MAEGRQRDQWQRTAMLCALTYNLHRGPKAPVKHPHDFNPYADPAQVKAARDAEIIRVPMTALRDLFMGGR